MLVKSKNAQIHMMLLIKKMNRKCNNLKYITKNLLSRFLKMRIIRLVHMTMLFIKLTHLCQGLRVLKILVVSILCKLKTTISRRETFNLSQILGM